MLEYSLGVNLVWKKHFRLLICSNYVTFDKRYFDQKGYLLCWHNASCFDTYYAMAA